MEQDQISGATLYDVDGKEIGRVEQPYADESGRVRFVRVKMGTLLAKHRIVPVDDAQQTEDRVTLPYAKSLIEHAPELPDDVDPLSGMVAGDLRAYYGSDRPAATTSGDRGAAAEPVRRSFEELETKGSRTAPVAVAPPAHDKETPGDAEGKGDLSQVRDLGDVVEIPVTEERLVKQPVVTEVVRVRKTSVSDTRDVSADLRKEEVEAESEGDAGVRENETT